MACSCLGHGNGGPGLGERGHFFSYQLPYIFQVCLAGNMLLLIYSRKLFFFQGNLTWKQSEKYKEENVSSDT